MSETLWVNLLNEGISFLLLIGLGFISYRGFKKNQELLTEREELLKRYILFRGDKQIRLKIYGEEENLRNELLKNISNSWKKFKKAYDQCLLSLSQNTKKTQRLLYLITLCLLINSAVHFLEAYFSLRLQSQFFYILVRELSNYILLILGLFLLRAQTHKFLSLKGEVVKVDREILFFPNSLSAQGEQQVLNNEFDPIEVTGEHDGKEDPDPRE